MADYKARHKEECSAFVYPPMTRAFVTEPVGDEKYAQRPVFAHAYREGVGCWVSVDGEYDCECVHTVHICLARNSLWMQVSNPLQSPWTLRPRTSSLS